MRTSTVTTSALTAALACLAAPVHAQDAKSFEVYGFAQADYVQDFKRVDPSWEATLRPSKIPTTDGAFGSDGQAILSIRQSRFGVRASVPKRLCLMLRMAWPSLPNAPSVVGIFDGRSVASHEGSTRLKS